MSAPARDAVPAGLRAAVVAVAAVVLAALPGAAPPAGAADGGAGLVPAPPLVSRAPDGQGTPGQVTITPAVTAAAVPGGARTSVSHTITNRTGHPVELDLDARAVRPGPDGAPELADGAPGPDAPGLELFADRVRLGPGEEALLRSVLARPDGAGPAAVALTAASGDQRLVAHVVAADPGQRAGARALAIRVGLGRDGGATRASATVAVGGAGPVVTDGRLVVRTWGLRGLLDAPLRGLLVWPGTPRQVTAPVGTPPLGAPVTVEAVVALRHSDGTGPDEPAPTPTAAGARPAHGDPVRASRTRWVGAPRTGLAAAVVLAVMVAAVRIRRRRG